VPFEPRFQPPRTDPRPDATNLALDRDPAPPEIRFRPKSGSERKSRPYPRCTSDSSDVSTSAGLPSIRRGMAVK
jgi:hypothetical protein